MPFRGCHWRSARKPLEYAKIGRWVSNARGVVRLCLKNGLDGWSVVGWLVCWLVVVWFVGSWLVGWLGGDWLVGWLMVGRWAVLVGWLIGLLVGWLVGSLLALVG